MSSRIIIIISVVILSIITAQGFTINGQKKQITKLEEDNTNLAKSYQLLAANAQLTEQAYQALIDADIATNNRYKPRVKVINAIPDTHDAPIAEPLIKALEALQ